MKTTKNGKFKISNSINHLEKTDLTELNSLIKSCFSNCIDRVRDNYTQPISYCSTESVSESETVKLLTKLSKAGFEIHSVKGLN